MDPLVERARGGDRAAMEELLGRVAPLVHRFGVHMCRDRTDADDVLQDTLLAVATHLGDFEGRSSLSSWVFTLARTACSRRRRGLKNRPSLGEEAIPEHDDASPSPEDEVSRRQLADALNRAIGSLPDDQREVVFLRDVEGLTAPEAAEILGITVEALKSRLHRGRGALRQAFEAALRPGAREISPRAGCPDIVSLWSRKLEGELSADDCASIEAHVHGCGSCGNECDTLKQALGACKRAAGAPVPKEVQSRVRDALMAWSRAT